MSFLRLVAFASSFAGGMVLGSTAALADTLRLRWDHCEGADQRSFDCQLNSADHPLAVALEVQTTLDSVLAVEVVLDVQIEGTSLPDWWALAPGGCRAGALRADTQFAGGSACADPWGGAAPAQVQGFLAGQPRGGPGQARILAVVGVPSNQVVTFSPGQVYDLIRVVLRSTQSAGTGACPGCATAACIVLNSVRIVRLPQSDPVPDIASDGGAGVWARWQAGTTAACLAVPVRNKTWGSLKSLYR